MHQRTTRWLTGAILAVTALLSLWLVTRSVASNKTRTVVVATRDLAAGEVIARAALDFRDLPESFVEDRHIASDDFERLLGMRTNNAVAGGASLLWTDLEAARGGRSLAALVQVGMRALSLPDVDQGFDGLLRPGDRVDVLFTPNVPEDGSPDEQPTVTVLENVLVLTVGRDLGSETARAQRGEPDEVRSGRVAISVTPVQAQRVAHAQGRGTLRLSLRNPHDVTVAEVFEVGGTP